MTPRIVWYIDEDGHKKVAIVYEGETTPWSWASLPGVAARCRPCRDGASRHVQYTRPGSGVVWLTSQRIDGDGIVKATP